MNHPTVFTLGRKPKRKPDTPCITAPMLKQFLAPILDPYLPNRGLHHGSARKFMAAIKKGFAYAARFLLALGDM